jgi:ATPase family AAA domain-containing protein 2
MEYINVAPTDFPEPAARKKRKLELLKPVPPEPPKDLTVLSKVELKTQKRRDRLVLNHLKLRIQPIMDQIKLRYKKFRTGVIDEGQIRYLYEEDDPDIVSTDLPQQERRNDHFRPYEKSMDDHGESGLLEVSSGKFYYNMEIVTIEKRLSNGYYKRPKDFLQDVKKLTKDARTLGDQERLLRANELQANVEVDMDNIEAENPAMNAEFEAVYIREMQREKELVEKANKFAAAEDRRLRLMPGNVSAETQGLSTEQSSGPVILGEPIRNGVALHPTTPSNPSNPSQPSQRSILTNGLIGGISDLSDLHPHTSSNGTSGPSREGDLQMTNTTDEGHSTERETQNSSFGPSAQTRPPFSYTGGPASLEQRKSVPGSLSQRSAITPMAEGSNPQDYTNYASTTTSSGKRVSGSSGPLNTQSSLGKNEGPDFSMIPEPLASNSQMPETQGRSFSLENISFHPRF